MVGSGGRESLTRERETWRYLCEDDQNGTFALGVSRVESVSGERRPRLARVTLDRHHNYVKQKGETGSLSHRGLYRWRY